MKVTLYALKEVAMDVEVPFEILAPIMKDNCDAVSHKHTATEEDYNRLTDFISTNYHMNLELAIDDDFYQRADITSGEEQIPLLEA